MAGALIAPALPKIAEQFTTYPNYELLTKLLLSLPALSVAVSSQLLGWIIDKTGRKKLLIFSLILFAISGTSAYWMNNLYYLLISRAVLGVAIAGLTTTSITLIGDYYSGAEREKFIGIQSSFMSLGGIFFIPLGGLLASYSWRNPFLMYVASLLILPFIYKVIYEPKVEKINVNNPKKIDEPINKIVIAFILFIAFTSMVLFYMLPTQIPFLLSSLGEKDSIMQGLAIATGTTTGALASFMYQKIKNKLSFSTIYAVAFAMQVIGYAVIGLATSYAVVIVGVMVAGFAIGLMMPNANLWIVEVSPPSHRGRMIGAVSATGFLGLFLSPIFVDMFNASLSQIFLYAAFAASILTVVCIVINKKI